MTDLRVKAKQRAADLALLDLLDAVAVVAVIAGHPDLAAQLLEIRRQTRERSAR